MYKRQAFTFDWDKCLAPLVGVDDEQKRALITLEPQSIPFERHGRMEQMLIDVIEERLARPHEERRNSSVKV